MKGKAILISGFIAAAACSRTPQPEPAQPAEAEATEAVELLFVQNAAGVQFGEGTMTLTGVAPTTVYFSDRPNRIAGQVRLDSLLYTLAQEGTFRDSPPNAVLVMLEDEGVQDVVMVLTGPAALEDETLTFPIQILDGDPPPTASSVSLFVDSAGAPEVWQTPGTVPRDSKQPGTMSLQKYKQPEEAGPSEQESPEGMEPYDYEDAMRWGGPRYNIAGPWKARGQPPKK